MGDTFPSERELCTHFGVSRTAVRSAIAQMEGRGLIEMGPNRRRKVRALPAEKRAS
ncbi:GntR family transcriptional regulator [Streptomyces netropsis]|uniref:GntR family transcriptional regulator n=1 Tax=Streptomyces netropsis TaxID=55404 RepID=UPI00379492ED